MRNAVLILACTLAVGAWAASRSLARPDRMVRIGRIDWHTDYETALALARQQGKPLWMHFGENPG